MAVTTPSQRLHAFDEATLVCVECGISMDLLEWQRETIPCTREAVAELKRDRYYFDLGRSSRDDEVADLELKIICLESMLLRSQEAIATETVT